MPYLQNSYSMLSTVNKGTANMEESKEIYLFQFSTQQRADYWMVQTAGKFHSDLIKFDKNKHRLEFSDSFYYFWSIQRVGDLLKNAIVYSEEDLYIILDDPERMRLESYEELANIEEND